MLCLQKPLIETVKSLTGQLDILVNNAGANQRAPAITFSLVNWQKIIDLNLRATFLLSQAGGQRNGPSRRGQNHQYLLRCSRFKEGKTHWRMQPPNMGL